MTSLTDICNRSLQTIGTRTDVTDGELAAGSTNEAKQFNLIYANLRDDLLRLAPWDCAMKTANLTYITSQPGTPENTSAVQNLWQPGIPAPPWTYEYQYPVDCLRAVQIIPANQTGFAGGAPITTAITGGASAYWWGSPVKFKIQTDEFLTVTNAGVISGGSGYNIGDIITLALQPTAIQITNQIGTFQPGAPQGAPVQLIITGMSGGVVTSAAIIPLINDSSPPAGGSYFYANAGVAAQASTSGSGTGATFRINILPPVISQRVILTNQEFATLMYVKQVTDPNVMDTLFQTAWINLIASGMVMALQGNRGLANDLLREVNFAIEQARAIDGNEGLTVNDVTSDWLRIRGVAYNDGYVSGPYSGYDFGGVWPMYN